jgi:hypothetical protein
VDRVFPFLFSSLTTSALTAVLINVRVTNGKPELMCTGLKTASSIYCRCWNCSFGAGVNLHCQCGRSVEVNLHIWDVRSCLLLFAANRKGAGLQRVSAPRSPLPSLRCLRLSKKKKHNTTSNPFYNSLIRVTGNK